MISHNLTTSEAVAGTIAVSLLVVQLALFRTVVLSELIRLYAIGSAFVAAICIDVGITLRSYDLLVLAALTILLKVFVLPTYMQSMVRSISDRVELPTRINVLLSLIIAAGLIGLAFLTSIRLPLHVGTFLPTADLATALSIVFIGFLVAILRPNALAQVIAFLTLENGLFFGTVTLAPGLPFVIGFLLLIDVIVAVVVFAVLVRVLISRHETGSTTVFQRLRG